MQRQCNPPPYLPQACLLSDLHFFLGTVKLLVLLALYYLTICWLHLARGFQIVARGWPNRRTGRSEVVEEPPLLPRRKLCRKDGTYFNAKPASSLRIGCWTDNYRNKSYLGYKRMPFKSYNF